MSVSQGKVFEWSSVCVCVAFKIAFSFFFCVVGVYTSHNPNDESYMTRHSAQKKKKTAVSRLHRRSVTAVWWGEGWPGWVVVVVVGGGPLRGLKVHRSVAF